MKERTKNNLLTAFAGESQARNKYTFFAKEARKAGLIEIAEIFEEVARNEEEHAKLICKLLYNLKNTSDNLKKAIEGEDYEYTSMYPEFEKMAIEDGDMEAAKYFKFVQEVEKNHSKRFSSYLEKLEAGTLLKTSEKTTWQCRECGYIWEGTAPPEKCPLCDHPKEYYKQI